MFPGHGYFILCEKELFELLVRVLIHIRAILTTAIFAILWYLLPPETPVDRQGSIDWIGAALGTSGLIIFNFVWK